MSSSTLQAIVWQRRGMRNVPGVLLLADQTLSFTTTEGCVFQVPLQQVENLRWPWYAMNAAFKATIQGKKYYLSFAPPSGTSADVPSSLTSEGSGGVVGGALDVLQIANASANVSRGVKAGKIWKAELARRRGA